MKAILILILTSTFFAGNAGANLNSHFYCPNSLPYANPADNGYPYEEISFQSADGTELSGWFIPAQGKAIGTVIHFHGHSRNISYHYRYVSWLPEKGFNLFMLDYRGYGKSQGSPSRRGVYEDSVAAMNYIKTRTDIDQSKLIVFGQSLGGANAMCVTGKNKFDGVVGVAVDSAFSSYRSIAVDQVGWLKPLAYLLIGNELSPKKYVDAISPTPLLIMHGTDDVVVPYKHAKKLFKEAHKSKTLWTLDGGQHIDALSERKEEMIPRLQSLFIEWVSASPKPLETP